jgi:hypothetical protein
MARTDQGPKPAPEHMTGDAREADTPPTRPDERGDEGSHAARIAETAHERITSREDRSHGTSAEATEEIAKD